MTKHEMEHKMKYHVNLIQSWLSANKLTLNVKKTKYMLIGSQFNLSQINSDFTIKVNNTPLERVIEHKSLEVQLDESLNWRPHTNTISKKNIRWSCYKRVSHFIPFDTEVNMYNTLVMPYFNYCGAVWGNINKGEVDKLQICRTGLLEFSPFLTVRFAQVFCWMSLAEKG